MADVICLHSDAFYALVDAVVSRIREKEGIVEPQWVDTDTAMTLLGIKSKTTLQSLRDNHLIIFTHPKRKIILYDRYSITEYLKKHTR
jgi:hypothetical protein